MPEHDSSSRPSKVAALEQSMQSQSASPDVAVGPTYSHLKRLHQELGNRNIARRMREMPAQGARPVSHQEHVLLVQMQAAWGNRRITDLIQARHLPSTSTSDAIAENVTTAERQISRTPQNNELRPVPKLVPPAGLILQVPGMTDEQLAKLVDDLADPELKKLKAEQKAEQEAAESEEKGARRYATRQI